MVVKPSEMTSLTCLEMAAIMDEVGLPPGVFNIVTGLGADAGAPLRYAATGPSIHIFSLLHLALAPSMPLVYSCPEGDEW